MKKIIETSDGSSSIFVDDLDVSYHSKYGAIQESNHVFLEAAFHFKTHQQNQLRIFEMGLGTGLNALLTFLQAERKQIQVDYHAIEAFPLESTYWESLNYTNELPNSLSTFQKIHQSEWGEAIELSSLFTLTKINAQLENWSTDKTFDIIYFDAFAPTAQPHLWEEPILAKMFNILRPGGVFVTYCAKGSVKRGLKNVGFTIESLPGPPGKREMTRGIKVK